MKAQARDLRLRRVKAKAGARPAARPGLRSLRSLHPGYRIIIGAYFFDRVMRRHDGMALLRGAAATPVARMERSEIRD